MEGMKKVNQADNKILFLDFRKEFIEIASKKIYVPITSIPCTGTYNIIAIDESGCMLENERINANYVLCPHSSPCRGKINCNMVISCGMSLKSTFGLSSTDKERSMFSVTRAINIGNELLLPFEEPFKPDKRLTLYENIILHGIKKLLYPEQCSKYCIAENAKRQPKESVSVK